MTPRATPMRPEERRLAIVEAVIPLILESGTMPTTREIAEAAGVAEGTIYRVFDDKHALLWAVAEHVLAPPRAGEELGASLTDLPDLPSKIRVVVERMQRSIQRVSAILMVVRQQATPEHLAHAEKRGGPPEFVVRANADLLTRLTAVFELHRDELRVEPAAAALTLRSLVFGSQHPGMTGDAPLTADQIADIVTHGVCRKDSPCC
ncbi:MAG: TetR/AcrR family transcriptional regulator [Nocardioides sp.]